MARKLRQSVIDSMEEERERQEDDGSNPAFWSRDRWVANILAEIEAEPDKAKQDAMRRDLSSLHWL